MAEEVEMTPVEMVPVDAAEPPKADPLAKPAAPISETAKTVPPVQRPAAVGAGGALKPGLKLPPKPGTGTAALKPGLKLPPKPGAGGALTHVTHHAHITFLSCTAHVARHGMIT